MLIFLKSDAFVKVGCALMNKIRHRGRSFG